MEIYQVGGSVRDKRLGLPVQDRDWVVIGATPQQMLDLGYRQVGKDFPVFLHPESREEYALARTERKTGPGYKGFAVHAAPDVTLIDDLRRRDLTINAMAETPDGELIDPFGGAEDLRQRLLRHVSPAFAEDPVRILRVARFAARFAGMGFRVAGETNALMRRMVESGEVDALVPERVWTELERALGESRPARFFEVLRDCGALARLFPEIDRLFGVPQPIEHHPEIDTGVHVMMVLDQAVRLSSDPCVRFAALMHDLGKGTTPAEEWPRHLGHEERGVTLVLNLCRRLRAPADYRDLAVLAARYHTHCHRADELRPSTLLDTLQALDAFRRPQRFEGFLLACEADSRGRPGYEERPYPQADLFRAALRAAQAVEVKPLVEKGYTGDKLAEQLRYQRIAAVARITKTKDEEPE
ncbi:MAG: multifunctional CCA addition/repair protein [Gammaproteobacteria bacterium]|nr:multifunctional CCA addition/repair protein [Gammaproteobacteria bacterium]